MSSRMNPRTKSVLEEISSFIPNDKKEEAIEARASHAISSAIHVLELIEESFDEEESEKLKKRFLNSIKNNDPDKFTRSVIRLKEQKRRN